MSKKYKITLVGHFADGKDFNDGQTVKTKNLYKALSTQYGSDSIKRVDTCGFKSKIVPFILENIKSFAKSRNTIILPAHNGVKVFVPFFSFLKLFFKTKLNYAVVGGWLPQFLNEHKLICKMLKKFDGIYVETCSMKSNLDAMGFANVYMLPNFKYLTPLDEDELVYNENTPHSLCIFSRIMQEKGVEDAIEIVKQINDQAGKTIFTLDLFGPVDDGYKERFEEVKLNMPEYVSYKGVIDSEKSVDAIKNYFALLFPTKFYTEGIPGTIIDAYAAGVPVISARWQSFNDVVDDHVTGIGYEFNNIDDLKQKLMDIAKCTECINALKLNCLRKSKQFLPNEAIKIIIEQLL